jgi:hypothetical protein
MRTLLIALILAFPTLADASTLPPTAAPAPAAASTTDHTEAWRALLMSRRATHIARLQAYADAGVFPKNTEFPGMTNVFLDAEGRPCAMAALIQQSGDRALVAETARHNNHVRLVHVTDGPLLAWIVTSGLTQEEVAMVQVPDSFLGGRLDPQTLQALVQAEHARLQAHFRLAAAQLAARSQESLETAMSRLGDRVREAPPAG